MRGDTVITADRTVATTGSPHTTDRHQVRAHTTFRGKKALIIDSPREMVGTTDLLAGRVSTADSQAVTLIETADTTSPSLDMAEEALKMMRETTLIIAEGAIRVGTMEEASGMGLTTEESINSRGLVTRRTEAPPRPRTSPSPRPLSPSLRPPRAPRPPPTRRPPAPRWRRGRCRRRPLSPRPSPSRRGPPSLTSRATRT